MRYDPLFSRRIGSVPAPVLQAMFETATKGAQIRITQLFQKVRSALGKRAGRVNDEMLDKALAYLIHDGIVEVSGGTVYRKRKTAKRTGFTGTLEDPSEGRSGIRKAYTGRIGRKIDAGGVGRKKAAGGRRRGGSVRGSSGPTVRSRVGFGFGPLPSSDDDVVTSERRFRVADTARYVVPIFYATDRERLRRQGFTNSGRHVKALQYGTAVVSFPARHRRGKLETAPKIIETLVPKGFVTVDKVSAPIPKARYHTKLATELSKYENALLIFVHGFWTSFENALKRTAQIQLDTGFNGTAIAFSWPSRNSGTPTSYLADRDRIGTASDRLAEFVASLRAQFPDTAIHIVAHSMGAEIAAQAMNKMASGVRVNEIVLQAPDIAQTDWDGLARALAARSARVSVYTSKHDNALRVASAMRLRSARVGRDVKRAIHKLVDAIDASAHGGWFIGHSYGFIASLATDLREILASTPQTRHQLEQRTLSRLRYYVFRR